MEDYFFNNTRPFPWGSLAQNAENQRIIKTLSTIIEANTWTCDGQMDILDQFVDYMKLMRSEFVTTSTIAMRSWTPLWTSFAKFGLYNMLVHDGIRVNDMRVLVQVCCEYCHTTETHLNPLEVFCNIFNVHDDFRMLNTRVDVSQHDCLVMGIRNAKHVLIERRLPSL